MFDANIRHLPKGWEFFAKANGIREASPLYNFGIRTGDVVKCIMLSIGDHNPRVKFFKDGKSIVVKSWADGDYKLFEHGLVYEGNLDLTGFIDDEAKVLAITLLEGMDNE